MTFAELDEDRAPPPPGSAPPPASLPSLPQPSLPWQPSLLWQGSLGRLPSRPLHLAPAEDASPLRPELSLSVSPFAPAAAPSEPPSGTPRSMASLVPAESVLPPSAAVPAAYVRGAS